MAELPTSAERAANLAAAEAVLAAEHRDASDIFGALLDLLFPPGPDHESAYAENLACAIGNLFDAAADTSEDLLRAVLADDEVTVRRLIEEVGVREKRDAIDLARGIGWPQKGGYDSRRVVRSGEGDIRLAVTHHELPTPTPLTEEFERRVDQVRSRRTEQGKWIELTEARARFLLDFHMASREDFPGAAAAVLDDEEKIEILAAGKELDELGWTHAGKGLSAARSFWERLRERGPAPEIAREARNLLHLSGDGVEESDLGSRLRANRKIDACTEYIPAPWRDESDLVGRDIQEGCASGIAQFSFGLGALEEKESGASTALLRGLVTRDEAPARQVLDKINADKEANARKAKRRSFTAYEVERVVGPTSTVVDMSFLRIKVVERAVAQRHGLHRRGRLRVISRLRRGARDRGHSGRDNHRSSGSRRSGPSSRSRSPGGSSDDGPTSQGSSDPPRQPHLNKPDSAVGGVGAAVNVSLTLDGAALDRIVSATRVGADPRNRRYCGKPIPAIDRLAVRNPLVAGADSERGR